jgi:tetratricopeptide (TPR) repeat protein
MERTALLGAYSTRDVAALLDLSEKQIRAFVRAGFLVPPRGPRGELRFSFQDLVLLRTAKGLVAASIPSRRVRAALSRLREQLPHGRPLSAVRILADGNRVIARDGREVWNPESGQALLDFEVAELVRDAAPFARRAVADARAAAEELDADDWFELGCALETTSPEDADDAYRRALALEPEHADAHLNLGRLLHEDGDLEAAEEHFRRAVEARPDDATAAFDLGVALEDLERLPEAAAAYERALTLDSGYADAHYNLAGICEKLGRAAAAIAHWRAYRRLVGELR